MGAPVESGFQASLTHVGTLCAFPTGHEKCGLGSASGSTELAEVLALLPFAVIAMRLDGPPAVDDRLDGCRPIAGKRLVSKESEFHPAATEKVSGFEGMRKAKAATRYPDVARGPVRTRALQAHFAIAGDRKQIVRMFCNNPKNISGIQPAEGKLFGSRFPVARSELFPV
jgi:hypothetical protein